MPLTVVAARDVESRFRGFMTSLMLEVPTGVYVAPGMNAGERTRLRGVLDGWRESLRRRSVVMIWQDAFASGKLRIGTLGTPPRRIVDADGVLVALCGLKDCKNPTTAI